MLERMIADTMQHERLALAARHRQLVEAERAAQERQGRETRSYRHAIAGMLLGLAARLGPSVTTRRVATAR
jgi:hypothetical protein